MVAVKITDRIPVGEILVRCNILELNKEINSILFKKKLPIREFSSTDFLLSQGKQFGINIKSDAYMFTDRELSEWGMIISLTDSSQVIKLVDRIKSNTKIKDSSTNYIRVFSFVEYNLNLCYGKDYLFLYSGKNFKRNLARVSNAKIGGIAREWKQFLSLPIFKEEKIVAYSEGPFVQEWGLDYALLSHDNDSNDVHVKAYLHTAQNHGLNLLASQAGLPLTSKDSKAIELHLDSSFKRQQIFKKFMPKLLELGKKIGFPTPLFIQAWDGNLSFREGGFVNATQRIVVTDFDADFNPIEITKYQHIRVPGYSIMVGVNKLGPTLMKSLYSKGIVRDEEGKLRFLFAPLLTMKTEKNRYQFTASSTFPDLTLGDKNFMRWTEGKDVYYLEIDSCQGQFVAAHLDISSSLIINFLQKLDQKKSLAKYKRELN